MKNEEPKIITRLKKNNTQDSKIKIRTKAKSDGFSVYFDFFKDGKREFEFLDKELHLSGTDAEFENDKKKLALIVAIRAERQNEYLKNKTGFSLQTEKDIDFITYFHKLAETKNDHVWLSSYKHFVVFINAKSLDLKKIDYKLCQKFADYLTSILKTNSAKVYYTKFRAVFNQMIKEELLNRNPASKIIMQTEDSKREFLSLDEIGHLAAISKPNPDTCNAFLFSCFTGLRISDLRQLTFDQIKDGYIEFRQQKTGQNERIMLNNTAISIINLQSKFKRSEKVFNLNTSASIEVHLKKWTASAGIEKHITFHCSRHSFATMALTNDIDLFTVSKLLGHRDIKTTQVYAKLIDKKKDEAINKMPNIKI